jgi:YidC/Oxa1 family membrane protein insertase
MQGMQKIQPKVNEIREKLKKNPQKMNAEIMELYKKHKVNPLGGCLPMILQIPVFFGLYKALLVSIELRHAESLLFWWINDLSAKDPYYITPLVMGLTMFLQQKMTPSTGDPKQQKMMMIMPVVMTFMFLNFPSGLVIYWLVNNILTIAQQSLINKQKTEE